ncbi:urea amidolyase family protein [Microbacterium telephonicum]|uniref:5-oxoprolinase subunit B/C family protein n=1 Tax=Microbacterium telephonicum TaxID=1714841 RepID=UPI0018F315A4|nr:urea amidolyase family protein [Microbacterium telephonicum]
MPRRDTVRILPFGDRAVLAEVDSLAAVIALHAALAADRPAGVVDLVPAARTVLVHVDPVRLSLAAARAWIAATDPHTAATSAPAPTVELPVVYDGADLGDLADLLGLSPEALVARHAAAVWTVAFTGFAPGFGYLVSDDWPFDVPRLASPRTRVPAGAVGLAGPFAGAYPRETPGGWQLIGTTPAALFDPDADPPALLTPGARVRFVPIAPAPPAPAAPASVREQPAAEATGATRALGAEVHSHRPDSPDPVPIPDPTPAPAFEVLTTGPRATVQDLGRPGRLAEGIAVSGAADRAALRTAHRLVGNPEDAAALEITLGGFAARARTDLWVAVTGAWAPIRIDGHPVDPYTAAPWPAGTDLRIDLAAHGARVYLAVRGGVDARPAVGSRSADTLSGLGPPPLAPGAVVALAGDPVVPVPPLDLHPWAPPEDAVLEVPLAPGPRAAWFTDAARGALFEQTWTVSAAADRVGIRLDGAPLERARDGELPSEGMLPGAIQIPPSGLPVILGPDGPVTGGYPVIAVVTDAARDALAQARPGTRIRFRHATLR